MTTVYVLAGLVIVVVAALFIVRWAFDFSDEFSENKDEVFVTPPPVPAKKTDYINAVLTGARGPSGIPGGFTDARAEQRYIKLVRAADALEWEAKDQVRFKGSVPLAHSKVGRARAMREAAQRLHAGEESVEASDSFVEEEQFRERERILDDQVRKARERK